MVLAAEDDERDEAEILALVRDPEIGIAPGQAIDAARRLGYPDSYFGSSDLDELRAWLADGRWPIVYLGSPNPLFAIHAVVVVEVTPEAVVLYDPEDGGRADIMWLAEFEERWTAYQSIAVIVEPPAAPPEAGSI